MQEFLSLQPRHQVLYYLPDLLLRLKHESFNVSINTHLRVLALLENISATTSLSQIQYQLGPLLATNEEQQRKFHNAFQQVIISATNAQTKKIEKDDTVEEEVTVYITNFWKKYKLLLLGLGLVSMLIIGVLCVMSKITVNPPIKPLPRIEPRLIENQDTIPSTDTIKSLPPPDNLVRRSRPKIHKVVVDSLSPVITDDLRHLVVNTFWYDLYSFYKKRPRFTRGIIALWVLLCLIVWVWWRYGKRSLELEDSDDDTSNYPPYIWTINTPNDHDIETEAAFYSAVNQMRRWVEGGGVRFHVKDTIKATVKSGGFPLLQYRKPNKSVEYLLLIDTSSPRNHQGQLFDFMYRQLKGNQVYLERFYYKGDPRICWNEDHSFIRLEQLAARYPDYRLMIFGMGYRLIHPSKGTLQDWSDDLFKHWEQRTLLTPVASADWAAQEIALADLFTVFPSNIQGIVKVIDYFETLKAEDLATWKHEIGKREESIFIPETSPVLPAIQYALEEHSHPVLMLKWIAACAIYPEINWDITLHIGTYLSNEGNYNLLHTQNLLTIARLEWFRVGEMPIVVRKEFLGYLSTDEIQNIRQEIIALLEQHPPSEVSTAFQDYRLQLLIQKILVDPEKRDKELEAEYEERIEGLEEDFTIIRYKKQRRNQILEFVLPNRFKKYFYQSFFGDVRNWVKWSIGLFLFLLGFVFLAPTWKYGKYEKVVTYEQEYLLLDSHQDSVMYYGNLFRDNLDYDTKAAISILSYSLDALHPKWRDFLEIREEEEESGIPTLLNSYLIDFYNKAKTLYYANDYDSSASYTEFMATIFFEGLSLNAAIEQNIVNSNLTDRKIFTLYSNLQGLDYEYYRKTTGNSLWTLQLDTMKKISLMNFNVYYETVVNLLDSNFYKKNIPNLETLIQYNYVGKQETVGTNKGLFYVEKDEQYAYIDTTGTIMVDWQSIYEILTTHKINLKSVIFRNRPLKRAELDSINYYRNVGQTNNSINQATRIAILYENQEVQLLSTDGIWHNIRVMKDNELVEGYLIDSYKGLSTLKEIVPLTITANSITPDCNANTGVIQITVNGDSPPYTYLWSNGSRTQNLSNLSVGNYRVTVTDNSGKTQTKSIDLSNENDLTVEIKNNIVTNDCGGFSGGSSYIEAVVEGGEAPYKYLWSIGATTITVDNSLLEINRKGVYSVRVTDANGCVATQSIDIDMNPIVATLVPTPISCKDAADGQITVNILGGTPPYRYQWNNGASTQNINNLSNGSYQVTITDSKGCKEIQNIDLKNATDPCFKVTASQSFTNYIEIKWNANSDVNSYTIMRSELGCDQLEVYQTGITENFYFDTQIKRGKRYFYKVIQQRLKTNIESNCIVGFQAGN